MNGIDWFNLDSNQAEAILPFLLQNLHDSQYIIAAQFLLCQPHLIRECPNRHELLQSLELRNERNRNAGKFVLKRLQWYQMDKTAKHRRRRASVDWEDLNLTRARSNSTALNSPYDRRPSPGDWVSNSDSILEFEPAGSHRKHLVRDSNTQSRLSLNTIATTPNRRMSGSEVIIQCKYRPVLEEMFVIVWDLPKAVVHLLMAWAIDTLAVDYEINKHRNEVNKHRRLRRRSRNVGVAFVQSQHLPDHDKLRPDARNEIITTRIQALETARRPQRTRVKKAKHPLEEWERDILYFLESKPRKNTRECAILADLRKREDLETII